jgi:hypothetical protein
MFSTAEYFMENSSETSKIDSAIVLLESNILTLKDGGKISGIDLKPLPPDFSRDWDDVYQKWILLKTILTNNVLKQNQIISPAAAVVTHSSLSSSSSSSISIDKNIKTTLETAALFYYTHL